MLDFCPGTQKQPYYSRVSHWTPGPNGPFFEVAVFVCTVNGAVRFGLLRFNGEDEELGPPAMQQVGDRAG